MLAVVAMLISLAACDQDDDMPNLEKDPIVSEIYQGAAIGGTNGMNFGPDGNLYVASFAEQSITVFNPQSGEIVKTLGAAVEQTLSPDDLAFGPDGSLYWTDINTGEVARMKPDGTLTRQFIAPGVNPITFSDDGRLIVGLCFQGDGLFELDPELTAPPRPIVEATQENPFPLGFLNAFDFGDDGMLYGPIFAGGIVVKVDIGEPGDPISTDPYNDGTVQVLSVGFTVPVAAKFSPDGVLHVLDQSGEVFTVDISTGEKTLLTTLEEGLDNLAFDDNGDLYVSNADFGTVVEVLGSGEPRVISRGGMVGPSGLAVLPRNDGEDNLFLGDVFRLRQHDGRTGNTINVFKADLLGRPGLLTLPLAVSADGSNILVCSYFTGIVQVWNPETDQVLETNATGGAPIDAIRIKGRIAVSDIVLGGVVFADDLTVQILQIPTPSGLATDGETLWAADWITGTVYQIEFNGGVPLPPTVLATGLQNPEGLAWDKNGGLLVVETGASTLSRINIATGDVSKVADGFVFSPAPIGLPVPPTYGFEGVAVGNNGAIYVGGGGKQVIYKIIEE